MLMAALYKDPPTLMKQHTVLGMERTVSMNAIESGVRKAVEIGTSLVESGSTYQLRLNLDLSFSINSGP